MTRKAPTGAKHSSCIEHVAHDYARTGWLCITTNTINVAWPNGRDMQPVDRAADMRAFADHLADVARRHHFAEQTRPRPEILPAARKVRATADVATYSTSRCEGHEPRDLVARPDVYAAAIAEPVKPDAPRKRSRAEVRAHLINASVPLPEPAQAPDAMTICNGCGLAPMLPDNAAGYCADCERTARESTPPEPVSIARPRKRPARKTSGRRPCPRDCGETFRRTGSGLDWHLSNRPECKAENARRARPAA